MSRPVVIVMLCWVTALNLLILVINVSQPSDALTRHYRHLIDDPDFARAVKSIAEQCRVNVDLAKLQC